MKRLLLFIICCFPLYVFAQNSLITASFTKDTVNINSRNVISNKLKLQNNSATAVRLKLTYATTGNLLTLPDTVTLQPYSGRVIPVKFLPSADLLGSPSPSISIVYTKIGSAAQLKAILFIHLEQEVPVSLTAPERVVYIDNITGKAPLRFRCVNRGYSSMQVLLKVNIYPTGLQVINPVRTLKLEPGAEQIIEFDATYLRVNDTLAPEFSVVAELTNMSGALLATGLVQVTKLTSRRTDMAAGQYAIGNTSGISYTRLNQANGYYTLSGNGNITPEQNSQLDYNLNINYYDRLNTIDAYDTWLSYTNKNIAIRAGNLMESLDFSMFGRGVKFSVKTGANNSIDIYGLQNSYLLFTQANNHLPFSSTYALNYNFKNNGGLQGNIAALFSDNPLIDVQTRFLNGRTTILKNKKHELEVKGGVSYETHKESKKTTPGVAAGADYTYRNQRFDVSLNNYFSTSYYSGLQRGVLQLNERITYRVANPVSVFGRFSLLNNNPRYLIDTNFINQGLYNNMAIYEAGINFNRSNFSLTFHPYLFNQYLSVGANSLFQNISGRLSSSSKRIGADIVYSFSNGKQLYILSDFGITNSSNRELAKQRYSSYRIMATYSNRWWGLNSLVQKAPYYLSEEAIASQTKGDYYVYSFGPNVHFNTFRDKLNVNISNNFNYTSFNKNRNNSLNAQLQYRVKNGWAVSGQIFYNSYSTVSNNYNLQTRVGVVKQFMRTNSPGSKKLKVNFYNDANNNNQWDSGESPIEGIVVNIAEEGKAGSTKQLTTVANKKGVIEYIDLKKGVYSLYLVRTNGWNLVSPVNIDLADNKKIAVPLVKSGWLTGKIKPVKREFITSKPLLEGIKVIATNDQNIAFTTLTNENGEFELPLPVNKYRISADIDAKRYSITNQNQLVAIDREDGKSIEFDLTDEARKVIVKQF